MTISEIRNIHPLVADLVCQRIREQGNEPDESKSIEDDKFMGGFYWPEEEFEAWGAICYKKNFEPLFSLYPELRGGKKEETPYHDLACKIISMERCDESENLVYDAAKLIADEMSKKEERIKELEEMLSEAQTQIEYLHQKFKATGSGNAVLSRISAALSNKPTKH